MIDLIYLGSEHIVPVVVRGVCQHWYEPEVYEDGVYSDGELFEVSKTVLRCIGCGDLMDVGADEDERLYED